MIGEFARRSRLPVSTLRYYDRIGLLAPSAVDPGSGYRRYAADQLRTAVLIARLRALGIAPEQIALVLAGGSAASATLLRERRRIAADVERGRDRLRGIDELLAGGPAARHRVEIVELAAREVATRAFRLPAAGIEAGVARTIAALGSDLRRAGHRRSGVWGATFPLDITDEVSGVVFTGVAGAIDSDVGSARLPAGRAVSVAHRGPAAGLPSAYQAAFAAVDERRGVVAGPVIEEYPALDEPGARTDVIYVRVPFRSG